jgi:hypothetical protein
VICHRFQSVVALACLVTSLVSSAPLTAGEHTLKSLSSLMVVDAHGTTVGPVISLLRATAGPFFAVVAYEVDQQPFVLLVASFQLSGSAPGPYFASGNCSGPPLVGDEPGSVMAGAVVSAPGHTVYVAEPDTTPQSFDGFQGTLRAQDGTCQPFVVLDGRITLTAARAVVDLDTLFTPPYRVR